MKRLATATIVTLMAVLAMGTPAQAFIVPVGDMLTGGSFGQRFLATCEPGVAISMIQIDHLSGVSLEAPHVCQNFSSEAYTEISSSSDQAIVVGLGPDWDREELSFEIWFGPWGDEPAPTSFRCTIFGDVPGKRVPMPSVIAWEETVGGWVQKEGPPSDVPEPGSLVLLGMVLAAGGLTTLRRRRRP